MKINRILCKSIFLLSFIFILNSCSNKENHKITWHFWTDATQSKLLKFTPDGKFYDLYNYSNSFENKYEVGEKELKLKYLTLDPKDSSNAEIIYLNDGKLVIKYNDNRIDSLKQSQEKDLIIGTWAPLDLSFPQDTFIIGLESYDCTIKQSTNKMKYFRYNIISDKKAEFDYYMENRKANVDYSISKDGLMLMIKYDNYLTTLKRI